MVDELDIEETPVPEQEPESDAPAVRAADEEDAPLDVQEPNEDEQ